MKKGKGISIDNTSEDLFYLDLDRRWGPEGTVESIDVLQKTWTLICS